MLICGKLQNDASNFYLLVNLKHSITAFGVLLRQCCDIPKCIISDFAYWQKQLNF